METIQGNDVDMITFQVRDAGGNFILVADWNDYEMMIYYKSNKLKKLAFSFKKTPVADSTDKAFVIVNSTTVGFIIDRTQTYKLKADTEIYAESRIQFGASSDYIGSKKNTGNDSILITKIIEGARPLSLS